MKFEKVTKEMIKRCTDDMEFYDKHGYFPWEKNEQSFKKRNI